LSRIRPCTAVTIASTDQRITSDLGRRKLTCSITVSSRLPVPEPSPGAKIRLVVLYGGRSAEHEVSCVSGFHVARAVDQERYDLRLVGITTDGAWVEATDALGRLQEPDLGETRTLPSPNELFDRGGNAASGIGTLRALERSGAGRIGLEEDADGARREVGSTLGEIVVLPLLHGPMGEDGTVQGMLEVLGLPYCGPGVAGSAAAMDKGLAKSLLAAAGLPQARHVFLREGEIDEMELERVGRLLGWPVFVKPANMGSSIGISKVSDIEGLRTALAGAARFDEFFIVEEAVRARELEIGVLGWPALETSVPGEIKPSREFYDFEDKYLEASAAVEIPAQLPEGVAAEMSKLAVAACRALRVDGMARVDFFFEEGGRGLLVNEINTIPGFTPISMYPQLWAASGVTYPELIDALVDQALRRASRRSRFVTRRN
jgi:D-alanine-D-alanine ligase